MKHPPGVHTPPNIRKMKRGVLGFTLVELLVVVALIGLLAVISLPRFAETRERSYRAQMQTDLRTLVTAQEAYFNKYITIEYGLYLGSLSPIAGVPDEGDGIITCSAS